MVKVVVGCLYSLLCEGTKRKSEQFIRFLLLLDDGIIYIKAGDKVESMVCHSYPVALCMCAISFTRKNNAWLRSLNVTKT